MPETVLINLLSEQLLPNFIAVLQENPDRVLALCTPEFQKDVERFEEASGVRHQVVPVDAYNLEGVRQRVALHIETMSADARVLINFTGGTKIMALAAVFAGLAARRQRHIELLYVETTGSRIDRFGFDPEGHFQPLPPREIDIHVPFGAYARLHGEPIKPGYLTAVPPEISRRLPAAEALLGHVCDGFFKRLKGAFQTNARGRSEPRPEFAADFPCEGGRGRVEWTPEGGVLALPGGKCFEAPGPDAGRFFCGGWLEEYCFARLADESLPEGTSFRQVLSRVTLEIRPESLRDPNLKLKDKTELDVVVCDGVRAAIIECKSGEVRAEDLHRLSAITRYLLGSHGVAVLAARFPLTAKEREIAEANKIRVVVGPGITDLRSKLARWFREG